MRRIILLIALLMLAPLAAWAQDQPEITQQSEDDKGFITRFLQDKLSGAGRAVVIEGFRGALSSRAEFDLMTIADDDGVWLTLKDGAIQWNRKALLRGRVEVGELTATEILMPRLPGKGTANEKPSAETREFALPELPVGLRIGQIRADRVELGEPVIGLPATVSLSGTMNLEGGEGIAVLSIDRLDGPRGQFALDAGFSNDTRVLKLDLTLDEAEDGLLANLIDLYDKPALSARIVGEGPLQDFTAAIELATNGQPRVKGSVKAKGQPGEDGSPGTEFSLDIGGNIASLLKPEDRAFFGNNTELLAEGWRGENGRLELPVLAIITDALNVSGGLAVAAGGAPESAALTISFGADAGATELPVLLPFTNGLRVNDGQLVLDYDAAQGSGWTLNGRVGAVDTQGIRIASLLLDGEGEVTLRGNKLASLTGGFDFGADGLSFDDAALAQAVGDQVSGETGFDFTPGNAVNLSGLSIAGRDYGLGGDLLLAGLSSGITVSGTLDAIYADLTRLSALAGRPLSGQAEASISGVYTVLTRGFYVDAAIDGTDIAVDQGQLDRLLRGKSQISLSARRDIDGISLDDLQINAQSLTAEAQGYLNSQSADVTAQITMPSLSDIDPDYGGSVQLEAFLSGRTGTRKLTIDGMAQNLQLGMAELDGALNGQTSLSIIATERDGGYGLDEFRLSNPQLSAEGAGDFTPGAIDARLDFAMPDLAVLGRGWSGALTATAKASETDGLRRIDMTGKGTDLRLGQAQLDGALIGDTDLRLIAEQKDGLVTLQELDLRNAQMDVTAGGTYGEGATDLQARADIRSLAAFGAGWRGALNAEATLREDGEGGRLLNLTGNGRDLSLGHAQLDGALAGTTQLTVIGVERDGVFTIDKATVENPRLSASASGSIGKGATDLSARLAAGDLRFLGGGFRGALNADAQVSEIGDGQRRISATGSASGLGIGQDRLDPLLAGQTRFDLAATQGAQGISVQRLNVSNPQVTVIADGSPSAGLNVDARLSDLGLIEPRLPGPAQATGTLREQGPDYIVNLSASGPGGTRAQVSGRAARNLRDNDLRISGVSDAAIANPFVRTRSFSGPIGFDLLLRGPAALESLSGRVTLRGGRLADPKLGMSIEELTATADLSGGQLQLDASGRPTAGGLLSVTGPVDLRDGGLGLTARLDRLVLRNPNLYEVTLNGTIGISGQPADGPLISGRIDVVKAEIRIPSTGLGGAKEIPDITHLGARPPVRATQARAGLSDWRSADAARAGLSGPAATPTTNPAQLDLIINAPNRVFIRGRGVDAEMGGRIELRGTARNIIPIGSLKLIRGRVDLLGKRFVLDEGLVDLQGSLVPVIRLVALTTQDGITTSIIIDGEARNPDISFESSPELPEEEVLSQLLFGRGLDNITALQAAQLANAVAVLAGQGGVGIVGNLRERAGLDDLDLATDDDGNVQLRAGKYLSENVYTDVSISDKGKTQLNLNLDISDHLSARGSVDNDGKSSLGLFFEKDY